MLIDDNAGILSSAEQESVSVHLVRSEVPSDLPARLQDDSCVRTLSLRCEARRTQKAPRDDRRPNAGPRYPTPFHRALIVAGCAERLYRAENRTNLFLTDLRINNLRLLVSVISRWASGLATARLMGLPPLRDADGRPDTEIAARCPVPFSETPFSETDCVERPLVLSWRIRLRRMSTGAVSRAAPVRVKAEMR
jgi:hypothetical protein